MRGSCWWTSAADDQLPGPFLRLQVIIESECIGCNGDISPYMGIETILWGRRLEVLVVRVAGRLLVEGKQFPQLAQGEVTLHILFFVHHAAAQGLLVGLSLQDLLLDGPRLAHTGQRASALDNRLGKTLPDEGELTEISL